MHSVFGGVVWPLGNGRDGKFNMIDLVVIALIVGFFLVSGLYVYFCDKL